VSDNPNSVVVGYADCYSKGPGFESLELSRTFYTVLEFSNQLYKFLNSSEGKVKTRIDVITTGASPWGSGVVMGGSVVYNDVKF
jgi:hypothetical protein